MGHTFTFVDLFAGIGGFHVGCAINGGVCVAACEINPDARSIYAANNNTRILHDTIYTLKPIKNIDSRIITFCMFSLNPFSIYF
jgi:DNA (cytosine-5)-methyltransferase 1